VWDLRAILSVSFGRNVIVIRQPLESEPLWEEISSGWLHLPRWGETLSIADCCSRLVPSPPYSSPVVATTTAVLNTRFNKLNPYCNWRQVLSASRWWTLPVLSWCLLPRRGTQTEGDVKKCSQHTTCAINISVTSHPGIIHTLTLHPLTLNLHPLTCITEPLTYRLD
jgi:hypothetical protein